MLLSAVKEKHEHFQQVERESITANERIRAQMQSLGGELNREGLLAQEQITEAIERAGNEQAQAEQRRGALLEEIEALKHDLPQQANVEDLTAAALACEQAERELEIEMARLQESVRVEEEQIRRNLKGEDAQSLEEAESLIAHLEDESAELKQQREALEEDVTQMARSLPENFSVSHLEGKFNEASAALRDIELEIKGKRARLHAEEERIGDDLATEGLNDLSAAESAAAESLEVAQILNGEIDEAWQSDKETLLRLAVPRDTTGAQDVLTNTRAEINAKVGSVREQIAKRSSYETDRARITTEIEKHLRQIEEWRETLAAAAQDAQLADPVKEEEQFLDKARGERQQADLKLLKENYQRAREKSAAEAAKAEQAERNRQDFLKSARNRLLQLSANDVEEINTENITARLSGFAEIKSDDTARLQADRDNVRARLLGLESEAERLELELYVKRDGLDYDECERELGESERRQIICNYAAPILDQVRENILRAVLPSTLDYMRAMLPLLTCGRYHDAELDDETYKIRVWDARAADYVEKEIFSGATQDQFSLALRLAFALATLPEGLGARPKFIFLDEPTAGFDGERRASFVKLLTEGELSARFDQIFLITPEGIFDSNPLPHYMRIQGGKIIDENVSNGVH
jgi:DNA repair exonuclease SbcCD ATPase subunit